MPLGQTKPNPIYSTYMYEEDLALNNLQWLICPKIQSINQPRFGFVTHIVSPITFTPRNFKNKILGISYLFWNIIELKQILLDIIHHQTLL